MESSGNGNVLNIFVKGRADGHVWSLLHDEQSYRIVVTKFLGLRRGDGYRANQWR